MTTKKSPAIENYLTSITGISRCEAKSRHICTWCKQPISNFRDALSKKEYTISGMCQACQDATFS